jgi:endonuclease/exonuclease/phosphatase family metal-dependent hydrolase
MKELLPRYDYYGVKRGGDEKEETSEMSGIFYLKDKFELVESDTFWISETPEKESKFHDAACYRICSFVVLRNKNTGKLLAHFNTHLDHVSTEAQNLGGSLIAEKVGEIKSKYGEIATVITGDFNQFPDGLAIKALEGKGFVKASDTVENGNTTNTYHGWGRVNDEPPIDFIFTDKSVKISNYKVHDQKMDKSFVSDHFMITAEVEM